MCFLDPSSDHFILQVIVETWYLQKDRVLPTWVAWLTFCVCLMHSAMIRAKMPRLHALQVRGWLKDNRASIVKKVGTNSVTDVAKEAGKQWKALSAAKKKPYEMAYAKAKAVFDKEMAAFKAAGGVVQRKQKRVSKKAARDPNMPKKPLSGYLLFMADNRAKIVKSLPKDHKATEVMKEGGAQWNKLTAAKKKPYES